MAVPSTFRSTLLALTCSLAFTPKAGADLLEEAREWRQRSGVVAARDRLLLEVMREDSDRGAFEQRIWKTNADKSYVFADAAQHCTLAQRARTGIFVVLGYRQRTGKSQRVVRDVVRRLRAQGWNAQLIQMPEWSFPKNDAQHIDAAVRAELPHVDRAILVGFSKGGWDWINWLHGPAASLPPHERDKLRLLVNFAAVLRGSNVADWAAYDRGAEASMMRLMMWVRFGAKGATSVFLRQLAHDPWESRDVRPLRAVAPRVSTIEYVAIPEGRDGFTHVNGLFGWINRNSTRAQKTIGPSDGMAECAAEILPRSERLRQWIVRVKGSHALLDGRYVNGSLVSRTYRRRDASQWTSGEEQMDDFMRALPRSAVGW